MGDRLRECHRCRSEQTSLHDYHGEVAPICWKCKLSGPYFQTPGEAAEWWNTRATDQHKDHRCKCDMRTSLVGDGCRYCNPQYYIDMLEEQIKEANHHNPEDITGFAHELWALAQLIPEEGILDGVMRIEEALHGKVKGSTDPLLEKMAEALERIDQWDWNVILQYSECDKEVFDDLKNVEQALQKYKEETCKHK